jgi:murein DD-endopeptidase MepM/ murein hydrolase activator NlpD
MSEVAAHPVRPGGSVEGTDARPRPSDASRAEVRRLAQEFEALLLSQMIRDMQRSMADDDSAQSEFGAMYDTANLEFGRALSAAGGLGLSSVLLGALDRLADAGSAATVSGSDTNVVSSSLSAVATSPEALALPGPVTSAFGWRKDPVTGAVDFHKGVDIGLAYGLDVRAAAPGRVIFAGESGSYGTMVRIAHADGRETRYAHLSEQYVRPGDLVEAGQVVGKSGSSGRATGPHLHFEMLVQGRPVDPTER